jgi:hypothetical protein
MWDDLINCNVCANRKSILIQQYETFRTTTEKRAHEAQKPYVIYLDKKEGKWRNCDLETAKKRGYTITALVS